MSEFSRRSARKHGGRPRGSLSDHSRDIRRAVQELREDYNVVTVRQAFYALTVRGVVAKTEGGYRQVQRHILNMRREGVLPWSFIADGTRWQRKPASYDRWGIFVPADAAGTQHDPPERRGIRKGAIQTKEENMTTPTYMTTPTTLEEAVEVIDRLLAKHDLGFTDWSGIEDAFLGAEDAAELAEAYATYFYQAEYRGIDYPYPTGEFVAFIEEEVGEPVFGEDE